MLKKKTRQSFQWKKIFDHFFSVYRVWQTSKNKLWRFAKYFDTCCANDMNVSLGPKRSIETNISKSGCFHDDKCFWPKFSRAIECHKHRETMYRDRQVFLAVTLKPKGALFRTIRGCWKQKVLKIRQIFHRKKHFGLIFHVLSNITNVKRQMIRAHNVL